MNTSPNVFAIVLLMLGLTLIMVILVDWGCGIINKNNIIFAKYKNEIDSLNAELRYKRREYERLEMEYTALNDKCKKLEHKLKTIKIYSLTPGTEHDSGIFLYDLGEHNLTV